MKRQHKLTLMGFDPTMLMSLMNMTGGSKGEGGGGSQQFGPKNYGLPLAIGAGQAIAGGIKKHQANGMAPPLEDIQMRQFLNEVERKRRALGTGAAFGTAHRLIEQNKSTTDEAIARAAGGDAGMTQQGLLRSQRNANVGMNNAYGIGAQQQQFFTTLGQDIMNRMSSRKLDLQMFDRVQKLAEAAQLKKDGMGNLMAGIAGSAPVAPSTPSTEQNPAYKNPKKRDLQDIPQFDTIRGTA